MSKKQHKPLTIGLCGESGAGKTQFAYQLLTEVITFNTPSEKTEKLPESAKEYYQALSREIEQQGLNATTSEHKFTVYLPDQTKTSEQQSENCIRQFNIIDMSGNDFIEYVESGKTSDKFMLLIKNSDVLIYTINLANPEFTSDLYIQTLKERVHLLLKAIVHKRGNKYLPVYFLFTHKDIFDSTSEPNKEAIKQQMDSLLAFAKQEYQNRYQKTFPRDLASPNTASGVFDLTQSGSAMQIIEKTLNLHSCIAVYEKRFRSRSKVVFIPMLFLLCFIFVCLIFYNYLSKSNKRVDTSLVSISQRVEILEQWQNDQIDENQKLNQKIDNLEKKVNSLESRVKAIEEKNKRVNPKPETTKPETTKPETEKTETAGSKNVVDGQDDHGHYKEITFKDIKFKFRYCPPCKENGFPMGEDGIIVRLYPGFWILESEVTNEMWKEIMGNCPSDNKNNNFPVDNVSWYECISFCSTLTSKINENCKTNFRFQLPTEAQWEYACRAENTLTNARKQDVLNIIERIAWYNKNSDDTIHEVKTKEPNGWGIYDMCGNACELVQDGYAKLGKIGVDNPVGPASEKYCVYRGGCYSYSYWYVNWYYRDSIYKGKPYHAYGFRVSFDGFEPDISENNK